MGSCIYSCGSFYDFFLDCAGLYISLIMKRFLLLSSFVFLAIASAVGSAIVGYRAYEESRRNSEIRAEIRLLQDEADRVDQENRKLRDRIEYLQSDSFREREAKRVLDYQKSGEKVILVRERFSERNEEDSSVSDSAFSFESAAFGVSEDGDSNLVKWWREFFGRKVASGKEEE